MHTLRGHTNSVYVLDSHPVDPRIIVSAGYDGRVTFWDINKGEAVQSACHLFAHVNVYLAP